MLNNRKELKGLIQENIWCDYTPDRAELRYYGSLIPVFLWDTLRNPKDYTEVLRECRGSFDYRLIYGIASTVEKYVPLLNTSKSQFGYDSYMLANNSNLNRIFPEDNIPEPRNVEGKVLYVSLKGLEILDMHYYNCYNFHRIRTQIITKDGIKVCYIYLNHPDDFLKYNPHENKYEYSIQNMSLVPAEVCSRNGKYEVL